MQPNTQSNLHREKDIRFLRAEQEFFRVIRCFGLICHPLSWTAKEPFPMPNCIGKMEFRCSFPAPRSIATFV